MSDQTPPDPFRPDASSPWNGPQTPSYGGYPPQQPPQQPAQQPGQQQPPPGCGPREPDSWGQHAQQWPTSGGGYVSFPPPPRRGKGLVVGLVTGGVLVLALLVGGLVVALGNDDTDTTARDPDRSSGGGFASGLVGDGPTEPPDDQPSDVPSDVPAEPSEPPSAPPVGAGSGETFTYRELAKDWDFRLGDVTLRASFNDGWDYRTCGPVDVEGALAGLGCERASEMNLRAEAGKLSLTHLVLTMGSERAATRAVERSLIEADSWTSKPDAFVPGVTSGIWRMNSTGRFVVITLETHQKAVKARRADDYRTYGNSDTVGYLMFR